MNSPIIKACVFGNPIEQSKSPIIHGMFAEQFDIPLDYAKRFAQPDAFIESATRFFEQEHCIGANVTMPFKHDAWQWVNELSDQAKQAGAVNTIIKKDDIYIGDNTDGYGLVTDLLAHNVTLEGARLLLIGAGGAAKGALPALVDAGISHVHIYNRSQDKAEELVSHTNAYKQGVASLYVTQEGVYDVIVNATSLSLKGQLPALPSTIFENQPAVYDMVYLSKPSAFLQQAQGAGCVTCIDGLGMLVHQAARSFYLWFDKQPNTTPVYQYLRSL